MNLQNASISKVESKWVRAGLFAFGAVLGAVAVRAVFRKRLKDDFVDESEESVDEVNKILEDLANEAESGRECAVHHSEVPVSELVKSCPYLGRVLADFDKKSGEGTSKSLDEIIAGLEEYDREQAIRRKRGNLGL